jgi:hypothetical protein
MFTGVLENRTAFILKVKVIFFRNVEYLPSDKSKRAVTLFYENTEKYPEVPGSIPGTARFSEWQWVWNGVHSALVTINEELLERKVMAPI